MDTIAAIATPPGNGGIGIVRISGGLALSIATRLFRRVADRPLPETPVSHRLYHGHIIAPGGQQVIDEVLLAVMTAPHSYTREDVVEIQAHAGQAVLRTILEGVLASGARLADPGEFTRRAFLNGRIDLTQAEAVIDVINAKSNRALTAAASQLQGVMGDRLKTVRFALRDLMTEIEAAIDFSGDGVEAISPEAIAQKLEDDIIGPLAPMCRGYEKARFLREGIRLAVVGRPNVGKSSLMNALLEDERAIVTHIPGTTRDVIEAPLCIDGIPILLMDTAGIHQSHDPVEAIGVEKTCRSIETADLILFVLDGSQPLSREDASVYDLTQSKERIIVINKRDLIQNGSSPALPETWRRSRLVETSALYGDGIDQLREVIRRVAIGNFQDDASALPNFRQHKALTSGLESLQRALSGIRDGADDELIAIDLQEAHRAIGEVIGDAAPPDILDRIFSQFCIGK